jgi:hypothetical protein
LINGPLKFFDARRHSSKIILSILSILSEFHRLITGTDRVFFSERNKTGERLPVSTPSGS